MSDSGQLLRFGAFALDSRSRELRRGDGKVKLQEQPFQILSALIEGRGEVVTREELRKRVWPGNTFVDFDNGLNVAIAKLRHVLEDRAEHPAYIETLPRVGYRFVALVEAAPILPEPVAAPEPTPAPRKPRANLWIWALATLAVVLGLAVLMLSKRFFFGGTLVTRRPTVAIMGFRNLGARPEENWLSTALSEMLATELAAGEHFRIIPGESVARTKLEMALPDAESYSSQTLIKIRKLLGADYVLVGSYLKTGGDTRHLRLDMRLQDSQSGETVAMPPENGGEEDLTGLVAQAGMALRQKLSVASASQSEVSGARAALPPSSDSARLYAEGLNKLRHFDARGARDVLGQAVAVNPGYALAHAALSDAWLVLGYADVARTEARKAWQLSGPLPEADRWFIEARFRESDSQWDQAIKIYESLIQKFPDNADYSMRLAGVQINAGKAREALVTLERLHRLPSPLADEAAIRFVKSQAAEKLGDFEQAQTSASQAALVAHERGAQILEADARALECRQEVQMSRLDKAVAACQSARVIYARTGNRLGLAASMAYLAAALCNQGNIAEARNLYTQALDIDREIGNARSDAQWALNGLAVLLLQQGDLAGSRKLYEESLDMARMVGSRPDEVSALGNIASTWLTEGELQRARDLFERALKSSRSIAAKATVASLLNNLGHTLYLLGDLSEAAKMLEQALETDRETGARLEVADTLSWLGRVRVAQANWDDARRRFDESANVAGEISGQVFGAQYRMAAAELALAMGRPAEAEAPIHRSLEIFRQAKAPGRELEAHTLLARTFLDQGKVEDARREVARANSLAKTSQQRSASLAFAIVAARTGASSGRTSDMQRALHDLQLIASDASRRGFLGYQFEARLAILEIQSKLQHGSATTRGSLAKLQKDARTAGFEAIARNAAF